MWLTFFLLSITWLSVSAIYVSTSGYDIPGCGTYEQPCFTISYAAASSPSNIDIFPGTYLSNSINIASNITIQSISPHDPERTLLRCNIAATAFFNVTAIGFTLKGVTIEGCSFSAIRIFNVCAFLPSL